MGKNFAFWAVGVAMGFLLATVLEKAREGQSLDTESLVDDIDRQLGALEGELSRA